MPDWALVIDDDSDNRELLAEFLESEGYVVVSCASAAAANEVLDVRGRPGVVVSDVRLPDMPGPVFVESLNSRPGFVGTPVIYVTGMAADAVTAERGHHVLVKPFDPEMLVTLVSRYCGAPATRRVAATV